MIRRKAIPCLAGAFGVLVGLSSFAHATTLDELQRYIDAGDFDMAAAQSQAYLASHPGNRDARFMQARALAGIGDIDKAIAQYEALARDFPTRVEPANNLAVLYADQGDYEKARRWLEKALATHPAYATTHRNLGDIYTALAELAYRKALGSEDEGKRLPLTMLDRLYYAQESVVPGDTPVPLPDNRRPVTPERRTTTLVGATDSRNVMETVRAWAMAWSAQDFDRYTGFYAEDFEPGDGMNRDAWLEQRRRRLAQPEDITIRIEDPKITRIDNGALRVDFMQEYSSPRYSDRVSKHLIMTRADAGWRIVRESTGDD